MGTRNGRRVIGVAVIIEHPDGSRTILGSRDVDACSISIEAGPDPVLNPWSSFRPRSHAELTAEMSKFTIWHTSEVSEPLALPQRGIYLPGMQFKALPAPKEGEDD